MRRSRSVLSRRKVLKAGLAGAAGAVLSTWPRRSASGQTKLAAASSSPVPAGQKYEVTFLTTQTNPADVKIYQALGSRFTESNPNITVKITAESNVAYDQKLLTYLVAGTLPDIVQTNDNFAAPFKRAGITRDMIPFAKKTGFPYLDFDPTFLNLGMVDGQLHMLPKEGDIIVPYVNLRMAKEGGVTVPHFDPSKEPNKWTWDEYLAMCRRLTVDTKGRRGDEAGFDKDNVAVYGAAMSVDQWYTYVPMIVSEGGNIVSRDLSHSEIDTPEGIEAIRKLTDPIKAGWWAPLTVLQTMSNSGTVFAAGRAAICPLQRLWCTTLRADLKDDFDVMHFPKGRVRRVTGEGTVGYALTTKAKNPDAAWAFLEFMYGDQGMRIMTASYGTVPAEKRYYNSPFWRDLPGPPYDNAVFVDSFKYGITPPRLPFYSTGEFREAVTNGLTAITLNQATPEQVAGSINTALNNVLKTLKPS